MSRKRFSKSGLELLEKNFEIVELLLKSTSTKLRRLEKELIDLENHRKTIIKENKENKSSLTCCKTSFYVQRISLCDRDIENVKQKIIIARQDYLEVGVCFKRCYYLMYGKPNLSDLK